MWSIDVAQQVSEIDRIIVSTDDEEIAAVGRPTVQKSMRGRHILLPMKPW